MINKWLSRATLDIIGEGMCSQFRRAHRLWVLNNSTAAFDYDYNTLDDGGSTLSKGYENIASVHGLT